MRRRRLLTAGATLGLAGCVSVPSADDDDPEGDEDVAADDLLQAAIETRRDLIDLEARRTMTMETPNETTERVDRIARRPPGERRIEVLESDDPETPSGRVSVRNRAITWEYYPEDDAVSKRHHPNRVVADGTRQELERLREEYDLTSEGLETVDGRDAHRIEAEPTSVDAEEDARSIDLLVGETVYRVPLEDAPVDDLEDATVERTIWIDDEYRYPIRERDTVRNEDGILHRVTVTYEDLEINAGLDAETFTYEPPEDAEVVVLGTEPEGIFESRAAAADVAPYDLPDPDVPEPYELDRVTVVERGEKFGTTTTLWYADPARPDREVFVAVREVQRFDPDVLEETEIEFDGHTAYYRDGRIESLFWACDELNYELSSPTADEDVNKIASSVGCS